MNDFGLYYKLGYYHITDLAAYDHILFLVALCAIYRLSNWKPVLVLVTAFTIGHSISLFSAVFNIVSIPIAIVEFLIPVTIILTCLFNISQHDFDLDAKSMKTKYGLALFFGLIHGIGFSGYLKETFGALLKEDFSVTIPLLAFNIGLEIGQILIIVFILIISYIMLSICNVKQREWNLFISGGAIGIAVLLLIENKFW